MNIYSENLRGRRPLKVNLTLPFAFMVPSLPLRAPAAHQRHVLLAEVPAKLRLLLNVPDQHIMSHSELEPFLHDKFETRVPCRTYERCTRIATFLERTHGASVGMQTRHILIEPARGPRQELILRMPHNGGSGAASGPRVPGGPLQEQKVLALRDDSGNC